MTESDNKRGVVEATEALRRHHLALAHRLRELRTGAGLSGQDFATLVGWNQSRVSRFETARQMPMPEEIEELARALHLSKSITKSLLEDLSALKDEWSNHRTLQHQGSNNRQAEVQEVEERATIIRQFELCLIPGLLQSPDYTRALCAVTDSFETEDDIDAAIELRQERQQVLNNRSKTFWFVLMESALWNRYGPSEVMIQQYEHLLEQSERLNIHIGVVPRWTPLPLLPVSSFQIFDDQLITVDTSNGELVLRHRDDIADHVDMFQRAKNVAVGGSDARQIINQFREAFL